LTPEGTSALEVVQVRDLTVTNPEPDRPPFMAAASGVSRTGGGTTAVAIGDDENHFWEGPVEEEEEPGTFARIIAGRLSIHEARRKEEKPDLEALTILPPFERNPHGALLACGSGGVRHDGGRRSTGVAFTLGAEGQLAGFPCEVDLGPLHAFVERHVTGPVNLEGVCVRADRLLLAQRGNTVDDDGRPGENMLLMLSLEKVMESMLTDLTIDTHELLEVRAYDLGHRTVDHDGESLEVKLDFTDVDEASGDPHGRIVFTAAAEGVKGSPTAGAMAGSAVGLIGADGAIELQLPVADPALKLEGVDARYDPERRCIDLLLVSDADDPGVPAPLMRATLPA
jgi:hypothetical protein